MGAEDHVFESHHSDMIMTNNWELFFYFLFSSLALASAVLVIRSKNAIYSVLFLILVFTNMAGFLLVSGIEFLSIMLIIIYVGAIAILFLFVVMMLDIHYTKQNLNEKLGYIPLTTLIGSIFLIETFLLLSKFFLPNNSFTKYFFTNVSGFTKEFDYRESFSDFHINSTSFTNYSVLLDKFDTITNTETIGQVLYSYYIYFFLIAGIILIIALIGAVTLTIQDKKIENKQRIYKQLSRNCLNAVFYVQNKK